MSLTRRGFFGAVAAVVVAARLPLYGGAWEQMHTHYLERHTLTGETREPLFSVGHDFARDEAPRVYAINDRYLYPEIPRVEFRFARPMEFSDTDLGLKPRADEILERPPWAVPDSRKMLA